MVQGAARQPGNESTLAPSGRTAELGHRWPQRGTREPVRAAGFALGTRSGPRRDLPCIELLLPRSPRFAARGIDGRRSSALAWHCCSRSPRFAARGIPSASGATSTGRWSASGASHLDWLRGDCARPSIDAQGLDAPPQPSSALSRQRPSGDELAGRRGCRRVLRDFCLGSQAGLAASFGRSAALLAAATALARALAWLDRDHTRGVTVF